MSHRQPAMDASVVATAPHARSGLISYTCRERGAGRSVLANGRQLGTLLSGAGGQVESLLDRRCRLLHERITKAGCLAHCRVPAEAR